MIILNVKSALFYYVATPDSSSRKPGTRCLYRIPEETKVLSWTYQQYSLRVYESDVKEWLSRWPENLKQAVKYEGYLRRKSVY